MDITTLEQCDAIQFKIECVSDFGGSRYPICQISILINHLQYQYQLIMQVERLIHLTLL